MSLVTSAATKVRIGGHKSTQPLGRGAFGGDGTEVITRIQRAAGIVGEDVIQRVAAAERGFKFFASSERRHLALLHDGDTVTMALRFLQIMSGEKQGRAVVGAQINEMPPDRVARNRVQPNRRLI